MPRIASSMNRAWKTLKPMYIVDLQHSEQTQNDCEKEVMSVFSEAGVGCQSCSVHDKGMDELPMLRKMALANLLQDELAGREYDKTIVKINSENLRTNGEMSFPANSRAWRDSGERMTNLKDCSNILEYYLKRKQCNIVGLSQADILKKATDLLIIASATWPVTIERSSLRNDRVSLFLERKRIVESAVRSALKHGSSYARKSSVGKSVSLRVEEDKDCDLTNARLTLIKKVTERMLDLKGFRVVDAPADFQYSLTTKSQGPLEDGYRRCLCGVVKIADANAKETRISMSAYVDAKVEALKRLTEMKSPAESDSRSIAEAIVTFELLSVKSNRPVFVRTNEDPDRRVSSSKGGTFVLYNTARISAILQRFKEEECLGHYPSLPDIDSIDFGHLCQEDEWELVYNFVVGYPEMIEDCVRNENNLETSPQTICLFLCRLSQKFSVYYRRTRILTEGRDHLVPRMMARLFMLRALQVVANNALAVLNITPVDHM